MTDTTQPEAIRLANALDHSVSPWTGEKLMFSEAAAELRRLHARVTELEAQAVPDLEEALRERDAAEDFIDHLLDEVLGHERPEWSSAYGRDDALNDVQERMTALHKPAVDKAWDQFQSAMAVPQQAAPMSPINRMIAYSAATKLRELGFAWDEASEAWLNPAAPQQAAPAEYFSFCDECGFDRHDTAEAAKAAADEMLDTIRKELGGDEWPMDAESVCWGVVIERASEHNPTTDEGGEKYCDYVLKGAAPQPEAQATAVPAVPWVQCTTVNNRCLGGCRTEAEHARYVGSFSAPQPEAALSSDTLYLLRRLLSNQHTLTGPEFREELTKIVSEAYQPEAAVDERAAFERWARSKTWIKDCGKAPDGDTYGHWDTQKAWLAWDAARKEGK